MSADSFLLSTSSLFGSNIYTNILGPRLRKWKVTVTSRVMFECMTAWSIGPMSFYQLSPSLYMQLTMFELCVFLVYCKRCIYCSFHQIAPPGLSITCSFLLKPSFSNLSKQRSADHGAARTILRWMEREIDRLILTKLSYDVMTITLQDISCPKFVTTSNHDLFLFWVMCQVAAGYFKHLVM